MTEAARRDARLPGPRARKESRAACSRLLRMLAGFGAVLLAASPAGASSELKLMPDPLVTGILLVGFIVLIFPLNVLIFRPLFRVIDEREDRIAGSRRRSERVAEQAEEALARYQEAIRAARDDVTNERRRRLEGARAELLATTRAAKQEAERELGRAREELDASLAEARQALRAGVEDLAELAAERILGRSLS